MAMAPFTDDERDQVRQLHAEGLGRNEISRRTGIHNKRVSAIAAELGLTFSRAGATATATAAKKADAASRRARLQVESLAAAEKLLGQMFAPTKVYNFGGKDNDYNEVEHLEPPFADKRAIATALQALAQTALKLAEYDRATEAGHADVDRWLDAMTDADDPAEP
jgi:hypothetical protein